MSITQKTLSNGLVIIHEHLGHVETVAWELYIPGGILCDSESRVGESLLLGELFSRGAGGMSAKELSESYEDLGIRHGEGAGLDRFSLRARSLKAHLDRSLELASLMLLHPTLAADDLDPIKALALQEIDGLEDNLARKAGVELGKRYHPTPYSRPAIGTSEGIQNVAIEHLRARWQTTCKPGGSVLAIAGNISADAAFAAAEKHLSSWQGSAPELPTYGSPQPAGKYHLPKESAQVNIVCAQPGPSVRSEHFFPAKILGELLSGGFFGRLTTEVREKRGLCYHVVMRHNAAREYGVYSMYAGTTTERAAETLKVMREVFASVPGTITTEEMTRAKINLKAAYIIGQETPGARVGAILSDFVLRGRVRSIAEIEAAIEQVTPQDIDALYNAFPAEPFSLLTLGAVEL